MYETRQFYGLIITMLGNFILKINAHMKGANPWKSVALKRREPIPVRWIESGNAKP